MYVIQLSKNFELYTEYKIYCFLRYFSKSVLYFINKFRQFRIGLCYCKPFVDIESFFPLNIAFRNISLLIQNNFHIFKFFPVFALLFTYFFIKHFYVKVISESFYSSMLSVSQYFSSSSYFHVLHGNLESSRLDSFHLVHALFLLLTLTCYAPCFQQIAVSLPVTSTYTSSELIYL